MQNRTAIYQGPSQSGLVLQSGAVIENIDFFHVGTSLLRTFTQFKWTPFISIPIPKLFDNPAPAVIRNCTFSFREVCTCIIHRRQDA